MNAASRDGLLFANIRPLLSLSSSNPVFSPSLMVDLPSVAYSSHESRVGLEVRPIYEKGPVRSLRVCFQPRNREEGPTPGPFRASHRDLALSPRPKRLPASHGFESRL